uniref:Uncharacterized protein n=1 Tax=viral metagenome TaxID=1070528 RepID=A0A6M3L7F1_9ZZZZ
MGDGDRMVVRLQCVDYRRPCVDCDGERPKTGPADDNRIVQVQTFSRTFHAPDMSKLADTGCHTDEQS